MKRVHAKRVLLLFFAAVSLFLSTPANRSDAFTEEFLYNLFGEAAGGWDPTTMYIENRTNKEISLAYCYHDFNEESWVVRGWQNVPPGQTRSAMFVSDISAFYYYAEGGGNVWSKEAGTHFYIVDEAFFYDPYSNDLPQGTNRRSVGFIELEVKDYEFKLTLTN